MSATRVKAGTLAEQVRGVSYGKEDASDAPQPGYLPVLRAGNITDEGLVFDDLVFVPKARVSDKQKIRQGDVVIAASSGSLDVVGKAAPALADFDGSFGAFCKVLRPNANVHPNYFAHFFKTLDYRRRVSALAAGANINNLRNEHLDDMEIPLPPLAEQRRIADVLDRAESLRAKRRAALAQLDTLTQSLFLDLFGDPATNPKDWPKVELGEVVKLMGGYAFKSEDFADEGNAVVRISNLTGDGIDLTDIARISNAKLGKGAGFKIQPGEILIAMSGATTGKLGVVPLGLGEDLYLNQRVGNYRIRDMERIQRDFLLGLLRSAFYQRFLWQLAAGVAQPNVSGWQLESAVVPLPPSPCSANSLAV